ncbi:hypothetical protein IWQ62_003214 [Dispira parvispora]|uniref:Uncharacterized protein n=1 Tax=Dispira parvispora TaxID=1520584 RepID=A0A9W8AUE3_9FUNG|nr:hypothetical protein IWQ62_003214 [Dispira parvispora]
MLTLRGWSLPRIGPFRRQLQGLGTRRWYSKVINDKEYPDLHWYLQPETTLPKSTQLTTPVTALLSFHSPRDLNQGEPDERSTIGWTTRLDVDALQRNHTATLTPDGFIPNESFMNWVHGLLKDSAHSADPILSSMAKSVGQGWLHIADERHPPPYGRIPRPEDIIGSVQVEDGHIVPHSYQPMPSHRLVSPKGLFRLSPDLHACMMRQFKKDFVDH